MDKRWQFLKFGLIGVFNTGWSYLLYALFLYLGMNYGPASLLTILLSIGVGFLTQGTLVFGGATRRALPRFIAVWVVIYGLYLLVVALAQRLGINNYIGGLIATPMVACLSYVLQSRFVFQSSVNGRS
jgi:putative flippase GtrA